MYICHAACGGKENLIVSPSKDEGDLKGNIPIRDLWMKGTESIHNMCVVNTDTTYYHSKTLEKCLGTAEK